MEAARLQREWQLEDRDEERAYNRAELNESRAYAESNSRQVFSNLVADAEKSGFNPLTVLRSGGASSYGGSAGFAPLSATPLTRSAPVRRAVGGSPVGDAIGAMADNFLENFDPFADSKREQEYRLVDAQIRNLNAATVGRDSPQSFNVPVYQAGEMERRPSGSAAVLSKSAGLGKPSVPEVGQTTVTNPLPPRLGFEVNPGMVDAAAWEERYGESELLSTAVLGMNGLGDIWHNVVEPYRRKVTRPAAAWLERNLKSGAAALSRPKATRKQVDNYSDPFPAWKW